MPLPTPRGLYESCNLRLIFHVLELMRPAVQCRRILREILWFLSVLSLGSVLPIAAQTDEPMRERIRERIQQAAAKAAVNDSGDPECSLEFGGLKRTYLLHLPKGYDGKTPLPLVVVFHGGGGNAPNAVRMTGMDPKADAEKFIVVYPNGTGPRNDALLTWDGWTCCGPALDNHVDDVGFVRALVTKLEAEYHIDRKRIYATGLSNGGMMTYRVGCELSDIFAAIAPVAGALDTDEFHPANPVSVIIFHGTADQHILYNGGIPRETFDRHQRIDKPVSYAVDCWVKHDGCASTPVRTKTGHITHDVYAGGKNGTAVELYTIEGQGHAWPGGKKGREHGNVDPPTTEISATDLMWDFFKEHPKP
jgi:polyhydroxybutyrate depolymerase